MVDQLEQTSQRLRRQSLQAHCHQNGQEDETLKSTSAENPRLLKTNGEERCHRCGHDSSGCQPAKEQLLLKVKGETHRGHTDRQRSNHNHQHENAADPTPTQWAEFSPGHIGRQQREQHRDRQLSQLLNQVVQCFAEGSGPAAHDQPSSH